MSVYKGTELLAGVATDTISNANYLLDFKWSDHIINSMEWLRADTFSWQSGAVYVAAYNHILADYNGGTSQTETVGSYTITYVLSDDGHKITTDETNVANIYNESGVAWYYILDTVNQRFKLPRTKFGFIGLRDTVGKYVPESLPNIKGSFDLAPGATLRYDATVNGAFEKTTAGTYSPDFIQQSGFNGLNFNASRSSSTYQNNAPVQQRATQMYLYFYVGQYSQSAIEQTAGLNASLFNGKVDLDGGNVITSAGQNLRNISKWSSNVSNCITDIPQDIKLELNNGTLTLKAGSKVYKAGGESIIINSDINYYFNVVSLNNLITVYDNSVNSIGVYIQGVNAVSSPTAPSTGVQDTIWFDTTNNVLKVTHDNASTWTEIPLPIALTSCTTTDGFTSIDQVFNGFGYIGSTVFALPGVKGLIPNGRNTDGSLKNIEFTTTDVKTATIDAYWTSQDWFIYNEIAIAWYPLQAGDVNYDESKNLWLDKRVDSGVSLFCNFGHTTASNGVITSFTPKTVFHALDYGDITTVLNIMYPIGAIYIGTQNTCPMSILIPGSSWSLVAQDKALWTGDGTNANTTKSAGLPNIKGSFTSDSWPSSPEQTGAFKRTNIGHNIGSRSSNTFTSDGTSLLLEFDASDSNSTYGNSSTVQPPAYVVNVWRRTV